MCTKWSIFSVCYWCRIDTNSLENLMRFKLSMVREHHRLISIEIVSQVVNTIMSSVHFRSALMGLKLSKKLDNINKSCTFCSFLLLKSIATTTHHYLLAGELSWYICRALKNVSPQITFSFNPAHSRLNILHS